MRKSLKERLEEIENISQLILGGRDISVVNLHRILNYVGYKLDINPVVGDEGYYFVADDLDLGYQIRIDVEFVTYSSIISDNMTHVSKVKYILD